MTDTAFGQKTTPSIWYVVRKDVESLLSGETADDLGIIGFNDTPQKNRMKKERLMQLDHRKKRLRNT